MTISVSLIALILLIVSFAHAVWFREHSALLFAVWAIAVIVVLGKFLA